MIQGTSYISSMAGLTSLAILLSFVTGSIVVMLEFGFDAFCPISMIMSTATDYVALNVER
jgi:hypothetical protein